MIKKINTEKMKEKSTITIFTPTFNRAHLLTKLYKSLTNQTCKDFVWMVVDGYSQDDTDSLINRFIKEKNIKIEFYKNPKRSKYSAILNFAIRKSRSDLVFFVDSDDYISNDAIEQIKNNYKNIKYNHSIAGFLFLCDYPKSKYHIKPLIDKEIVSYVDLELRRNDKYDTCCQIYKTSVLSKTVFPNFNEEFMPESLLWNIIDKRYKMMTINSKIYYREYNADGYTIAGRWRNLKSPRGARECKKVLLERRLPFTFMIKTCLLYIIYSLFANLTISFILKDSPRKILTVLLFPSGIIIYMFWKKYK